MIVSGSECPQQAGADEVARMTLQCLLNTVPAAVPGIAFLSGGLGDEAATANLNAINVLARERGQCTLAYYFFLWSCFAAEGLKGMGRAGGEYVIGTAGGFSTRQIKRTCING